MVHAVSSDKKEGKLVLFYDLDELPSEIDGYEVRLIYSPRAVMQDSED